MLVMLVMYTFRWSKIVKQNVTISAYRYLNVYEQHVTVLDHLNVYAEDVTWAIFKILSSIFFQHYFIVHLSQ